MRPWSLLACTTLLPLALSACLVPSEAPRPERWADTPRLSHSARALPKGSAEGEASQGGSLLDQYADRTPRDSAEGKTWSLPTHSKMIVVEALIAAVVDDPGRMLELLTLNASWGTPDRRQLRARPVSTKQDPYGIEFLDAFRAAASRLNTKAKWGCRPLQPNWALLVEAGAEPMWCSFNSTDGYDLLVFRLVKEQGDVRIDYVGLFVTRPTGPTYVHEAGLAPPATPYTKVGPDEIGAGPSLGRGPKAGRPQPRPQPRPQAQPRAASPDAPIPVQPERPIPVQPERPIPVQP